MQSSSGYSALHSHSTLHYTTVTVHCSQPNTLTLHCHCTLLCYYEPLYGEKEKSSLESGARQPSEATGQASDAITGAGLPAGQNMNPVRKQRRRIKIRLAGMTRAATQQIRNGLAWGFILID